MTDRLLDQIQAGLTAQAGIDWQQMKAAMDAPLRAAVERTEAALREEETQLREACNRIWSPAPQWPRNEFCGPQR